MATIKRNSGNQDYTNNADGFDVTGGTTRRKLTVTGADMTLTGGGSNTYTFPAATSTLWGDDRIKIVALGSNFTNATTTMNEVTGFNTTLGSGTYHFKFVLICTANATTNSFKFSVNHTGTTSVFVYNLYFPSQGVTAATGVVDQVHNATTGNVWAFQATRTKNATLGPQTGVDTGSSDIMIIIEGFFINSTSGDFELYEGAEEATTTTIKAGSFVTITKAV